jgi:hypothetical protein
MWNALVQTYANGDDIEGALRTLQIMYRLGIASQLLPVSIHTQQGDVNVLYQPALSDASLQAITHALQLLAARLHAIANFRSPGGADAVAELDGRWGTSRPFTPHSTLQQDLESVLSAASELRDAQAQTIIAQRPPPSAAVAPPLGRSRENAPKSSSASFDFGSLVSALDSKPDVAVEATGATPVIDSTGDAKSVELAEESDSEAAPSNLGVQAPAGSTLPASNTSNFTGTLGIRDLVNIDSRLASALGVFL